MAAAQNLILREEVEHLSDLFRRRVELTPEAVAYCAYDAQRGHWFELQWQQMAERVAEWRTQLQQWSVEAGERLAILLDNSPAWVAMDQTAAALNLITVPLFFRDRVENMAYVIAHSGARTLVVRGAEQWDALQPLLEDSALQRVIQVVSDWERSAELRLLWSRNEITVEECTPVPPELATIIYTSGTTGQPKGVMLSHRNIISNCFATASVTPLYPEDRFLSFLPLSHALERTVGYYLPLLAGASVAFARAIETIQQDLVEIRPTVLVSVPRLFEKVDERFEEKLAAASPLKRLLVRWAQRVGRDHFRVSQRRCCWKLNQLFHPLLDRLVGQKVRDSLGGRLRIVVSGGAPLLPSIADRYIGFGVPILQGYGLTECSPVVSGNSLEWNVPEGVGRALPEVETRIDPVSHELQVRGPGLMMGYWENLESTREVIDHEGWFHTGDVARMGDENLYITGRIKEILVLSNGEKVPPVDVELAIQQDRWIDQVMVVGEGQPSLTALVVLSRQAKSDRPKRLLRRINRQLHAFPGYAKVKQVVISGYPWTLEAGLVTPTMKLRRKKIVERFQEQIESASKK